MSSATPCLSRVFFTATAAFVLAAPAAAAPAFLKLGGVDGSTKAKDNHKDEIEILSYTWGESQAGKVSKVDSFTVKQGTAAKESGEKGGTEDINIGVGELQESKQPKTRQLGLAPGGTKPRPAGDEEGNTQDMTIGVGESLNQGGVSVAAGDVNGDTASGMPTGKRQHGWVTVSKPLDRGAVRVKVKFPWVGCRVGARYPSLELGEAKKSYVLHDVTVASCGSASGDADDRPTEEIAFYYNKISFNYAATGDAR